MGLSLRLRDTWVLTVSVAWRYNALPMEAITCNGNATGARLAGQAILHVGHPRLDLNLHGRHLGDTIGRFRAGGR